MNRTTRSPDRFSRQGQGKNPGQGQGRSKNPARGGRHQPRAKPAGPGRGRQAAPGGEFAAPVTLTPALDPVESFTGLGLPAPLLAELDRGGVTAPFPIQAATLPNSLAGRDVLGRGRTGSGKTLAFGLALLARIAGQRAEPLRPLAMVLVPTRELAQQVSEALTPYARSLKLRLATVVGGMSITRQSNALRNGAEVVVATPGRLKDLIGRGDCRLDQVRITVLDEADQMADMGFMPQVTELLEQVPSDGQRMLFSATLDRNIDKLVRRYLSDPVVHSVDPSAGAVTTMEHHVLHVTDDDKHTVTLHIAAREGRVLMFMDTKRAVDRMTKRLLANGVRAGALHGGRSQSQRNRTLEQFRNGHVTALIATNVAARGIHIDGLDLVVNIDPPTDHKDYLHRGGRTARAGESGSVVTVVLPHQRREMTRLLATAEITAQAVPARPGDPELARVTGAREPSGVPVVVALPAAEGSRAASGGTRSRRNRSSGSAQRGAGPQGGGAAQRTGGTPRTGGGQRGGAARRPSRGRSAKG